ncbi:isochorismate synthase [Halorubraceae archaeon YAN]|nr:isochorismate synthase [Halorubraceae archaeon YAN]
MSPPQITDRQALVSRATPINNVDIRAVLDATTEPRIVWGAPDQATVVGWGSAATLVANGPDRFSEIQTQAEALFSSGDVHAGTEAARPRLFGGFSFHEQTAARSPWNAFPDARFVFPRVQVTYADSGVWLTVNAVGEDATPTQVEDTLEKEKDRLESLEPHSHDPVAPGIGESHRTTTKQAWTESVNEATRRINAGELQKVVLAQALEASLASEPSIGDILNQLSVSYPNCHLFTIEPPASDRISFFGASPERLVSVHGRTVETDALAGTTGRGETPAEDEWLAEELLADPKNTHEHQLVVETIREQLKPYIASISVGDRRVKRLATVQHLHTPITAELATDEHVLSLVEALHPTPAVGGLPPEKALETIIRTEPFERGWYAAPVGWIDAAGNGTFAVALRSAVTTPTTATLFAGVGLVADSDPDAEWDEVELKYRSILDVLEGSSVR